MKNVVVFLLLLFGISGFSQSSECMFYIPLSSGDSILVNSANIKYAISSPSGSTIIQGDQYVSYSTLDDIPTLVVSSSGELVQFTDNRTGVVMAMSRAFISEVWERGNGRALLISRNPRYRWETREQLSALSPFLQACATGGGSNVYSGTNVGGGSELFKQTTGANVHEFRTIQGTNAVEVTQVGDNIVVNSEALDSFSTSSEFNGVIRRDSILELQDNSIAGSRLQNLTIEEGKIADDAVSFAKTQNINSGTILGRSNAGVGNIEQILIGSGLSLNLGVLSATGGGGSGDNNFDSNRPILRVPTAGTNIGGSTVQDFLEWWYFTPPTISIASITTPVEVGTSNSIDISSTTTNNGGATLSNGYLVNLTSGDTLRDFGSSLTADSTITYTPQQSGVGVYDELSYSFNSTQDWVSGPDSGTATSNTRTVQAVYPVFYGMTSDTLINATGTDIYLSGLTKLVETEGNKTVTLSGTNQYIYYIVPDVPEWSDPILSSIIDPNGFDILGGFTMYDISVSSTGLVNDYINVPYKLYRLNNLTTVVGSPAQNYTFNR